MRFCKHDLTTPELIRFSFLFEMKVVNLFAQPCLNLLCPHDRMLRLVTFNIRYRNNAKFFLLIPIYSSSSSNKSSSSSCVL